MAFPLTFFQQPPALQGRPEHSGRRRWPWLCDWISANMESSLTHWFGHVRVVRHGSAPLKPETDKYILGFHPHGLYPTGEHPGIGGRWPLEDVVC